MQKNSEELLILVLLMCFYSCTTFFKHPQSFGWSSYYNDEISEKWPKHHRISHLFDPPAGSASEDYIVTEGYILTKNNDTLKGYIKIPFHNTRFEKPSKPIPFLPFNKTKATDIINVKLDSINYIRIKQAQSTDSADFIPFKSSIWLLVGRKNNIAIYYRGWRQYIYDTENSYQYETNGAQLILISEKNTTNMPILKILQFINKRYGQHFSKKDFKDGKAMINYILDKENENQNYSK
jgi:hypothetical protein